MIEHWFHAILAYVSNHPNWGIAFAFLISFAESLPLIGTIIPGSVTMTAVGTLIGARALPAVPTLMWASVGAFCGDCIGYYLGKYCDNFIRNMWPFSKHPKWIKKGEDYFHLHGGKSIIIGRFVGPVRSTIPLIAGLLKLSTLRFMAAAIPSAICWALAYTIPGILLGALSLDLQPHVASKFILIGLAIVVLCWFLFWACFRLGRATLNSINNQIHRLWQVMAQHKNSLYRALKRSHYPNDHHQLTLFIFAIISVALFCWVFISVVDHGCLTLANRPVLYLLQSIHNLTLSHILTAFTLLGDKPVILGFALLMVLWLATQKHYRAAYYLFFTGFVTAALIGVFKLIYYSARPISISVVATSSSFPSGHTALTVVILGFAAYLGTLLANKFWRKFVYTTYVVLTLLVALSRLYLGAHWVSDILGSVTLGGTILFTSILLYRRKLFGTAPTKPWLTAIALALLIPWITYGAWQYQKTLSNYRLKFDIATTTTNRWWLKPNKHLPLYRNNRFGKPFLPFNVQWLSNFSDLRNDLLNNGWKLIDKPTSLSYNINRLKSLKPKNHLPIVPILYCGQQPRATFYRPSDEKNRMLELTLWMAPIKFLNNDTPLWIGTLDYHRSVAFKVLQLSKQIHSLVPNDEIKKLMPALAKYQTKIINVPHHQQPHAIKKLKWNGQIIIIQPQ
ncbi:MAG: VTT domain-containing protein [Coxiellaceae bacterium]|nr:VTT domain-containing protein [Coxiellaceae bacterium]